MWGKDVEGGVGGGAEVELKPYKIIITNDRNNNQVFTTNFHYTFLLPFSGRS